MSSILDRFEEKEGDISLDPEKYLTFLVDNQYYAFPIKDVRILRFNTLRKYLNFHPMQREL